MLVQSISGIRGIYGTDLDLGIVNRYAHAFYKLLLHRVAKPIIVIGRDTRISGAEIRQEFLNVLCSYGCSIIDVDVNTTPAIQLGVREFKADGGIIITASHNAPEYNGMKFLDSSGSILKKDDFDKLQHIFTAQKVIATIKPFTKIHDSSHDLHQRYIDFLVKYLGNDVSLIKKINTKILLDPNGGAACVILKDLFVKLGLNIVIINNTLGEFKRIIEPNEKSLLGLVPILKKEKAEFAAGFDCDADRLSIIMNNGEMLSGHYVLALCIDEILSQIPNPEVQTIVVNDATSYLVKEIVDKYHAHYMEVEAGEINVVSELYRLKAIAGGEGSSGGGVFPPSTSRDGILMLLIILKAMARRGKNLSEIIMELPVYYTLQEQLKCLPEQQLLMKQRLKNYYIKKFKISETGDETGGLKVFFSNNSWIWYRISKTESGIFRIVADAKNEIEAQKLLQEGIDVFNSIVNLF
jgi:phosphomannomutase